MLNEPGMTPPDPKGTDMAYPNEVGRVRVICTECGKISAGTDILVAQSPFDATDVIHGCPHCLCVTEFQQACDYGSCKNPVSGGHPMPNGSYAHRCWVHSPRNKLFSPPPEALT